MNALRLPRRARGQSMTEFLVVFPVMLLLVFGIIQFALLYQTRLTLNHATMLAARAGALNNGDQVKMRAALANGLAPLFAKEATLDGYTEAVFKANLETNKFANMVNLTVLNPTRPALNDFGRTKLDGTGGRELPNDTLSYRSTGAGASSRISVQDANILHVRVEYCTRLIVPVVDRVIHAAVNAFLPYDPVLESGGMSNPFGLNGTVPKPAVSCFNPLFKGPRIRIQSEAFIRMQSPFYESNLQ